MDGNLTAISNKMREMVLTSNDAVQYKLAYAALRLKDANIAYFDAYGVVSFVPCFGRVKACAVYISIQ